VNEKSLDHFAWGHVWQLKILPSRKTIHIPTQSQNCRPLLPIKKDKLYLKNLFVRERNLGEIEKEFSVSHQLTNV
jgi:hypothetical protein